MVWADEILHCLLLAAVTGIRPSGVMPLHHVGLAASDLAPQAVETFPNCPLEVSTVWKSLHCSDLHVWCGVIWSIEGASDGGEVLGLRCDGKIVDEDETSRVRVDGLVVGVDVKQKRSKDTAFFWVLHDCAFRPSQ